ncbi:MAG: FHA domain-containing protein [Anaerolineales bacterium]|jgi:hypothetical protein
MIVLVVGVFLISYTASAQSASRAVVSGPNLEEFPQITAYLDVMDASGIFIPGLGPGDVAVVEDDAVLPGQVTEIRPGAQIVLAFNPGSSFNIVDFEGNNRFYYLSQALAHWWGMQAEADIDNFSIVTSSGTLLTHSSVPSEWQEAWNTYEPDLRTAIPNLEILSTALDVASDPTPGVGIGRVILFLTPTLSPEWGDTVQSLADRAIQSNVRVHVGLIDSPSLFTSSSASQLQALAFQTGGQFFVFSNEEPIPDFQQLFESSRRVYQLTYRSQINTPGEHTFFVQVNTPGGEILSGQVNFEVQLRPPTPIFVELPSQIVRAIPDDADVATENLEPKTYTVEVFFEFPDTIPRAMAHSSLYANGQIAAENTSPPFELFNFDLTQYATSDEVVLMVEATDELGLTGNSVDIPVQITIQRPAQGLLPTLARNATVIAFGFVVLAGGILILVLLLAGRLRPRSIGEQWRSRAAYDDPVTQPLRQIEEQYKPKKSLLERFRRRPSDAKGSQAQRPAARGEPFAYLTPISEEGMTEPDSLIQVTTTEITFGSEPDEAVVVLKDPAVAPLHSRLWRDEKGEFHIADQESVGGTWVNFAPVSKTGCEVEHGDLIHIANIGFRFSLERPTRPRQTVVRKG